MGCRGVRIVNSFQIEGRKYCFVHHAFNPLFLTLPSRYRALSCTHELLALYHSFIGNGFFVIWPCIFFFNNLHNFIFFRIFFAISLVLIISHEYLISGFFFSIIPLRKSQYANLLSIVLFTSSQVPLPFQVHSHLNPCRLYLLH